ncbi:histidine kinase [Burkholderia pseudomallei]|uniref:histidine kinase n=1 Tax=Burkholderia pseudomallei TaxID=28450 RepID=UPI000E7192C8|nr:histidine kinase [Burkholderia pseudomallei]AYE31965.1 histidine kinase [Burkholderia pseudomallei]MBF3780299.1 histidine kinase [Burkholderia pseudomallei]MBF4060890.1 histidine kinase [Burkholderia pseudomallei]MBF4078881.1 histidine kinase [Burkholderia pseudomallei]
MAESSLVDDASADIPSLKKEIVRLNKIVRSLMDRAERSTIVCGSDFSLFQMAVTLEDQVRHRTRELEAALHENQKIMHALQRTQALMAQEIEERKRTQAELETEREAQRHLIEQLAQADGQLLQSEKLASIGQLAAGVAHEINNPIGFVDSNLRTLKTWVRQLLDVMAIEDALIADCGDAALARLRAAHAEVDLDYLRGDIGTLIDESIEGASRVRRIVQDLRDFSRAGSEEWNFADVHEGLEATLNVLRNELKYKAEVVKDYGELPAVECMPSQLNQVVMNLLMNAAQAIVEHGTITIRTRREGDGVTIAIEDTGVGIPADRLAKIFDPFYTTKPVGKGTGLGLSVSYGIVEKHGGRITVDSEPGNGSRFTIWLPIVRQRSLQDAAAG